MTAPLLVVAGLLFFSTPLAPLWGPALGLESFGGVPPALGRWAFAGLNIGVVTILVVATGGLRRSPFAALAVAIPPLAWRWGFPSSRWWGLASWSARPLQRRPFSR